MLPPIDIFDIRIPEWIQIFVLAGIGLVIVAVPLRIVWSATRGVRDHARKMDEFADRLRERFNEVSLHRGWIGPTSITFKHENRKACVRVHGARTLVVQLEENVRPKFPCVVRTHRRFLLPIAVVGLRWLPRIRTLDTLVDESVAIYTTPIFGGYLRELILEGVTLEGKATGLAESLIVLRKLAGVRSFTLVTAPERPMTMRVSLRTEDVLYRPDEIESIVHHMGALYDRFVND